MRRTLVALALLSFCAVAGAWMARTQESEGTRRIVVGYSDTPHLPGSQWRVHDPDRQRPATVIPGTGGTQERPGEPPSDALVLFDGTSSRHWQAAGKPGEKAGWELREGALVVNGTGSIETRMQFGDMQLHLEWRTPAERQGDSQARGNSGVFLMGRYEVQILDSFENLTYADGQAAALYGQLPPLVNACRGPGEWQSYDIVFSAPRFAEGELVSPARVSVFHNGVLAHYDRAFLGPTTHRALARYTEHGPVGPIQLQDHGAPVEFRNIWVRPFEHPSWRGE